ncbi:MAG: MFS transporter, partial [Actinomycetes bacterium]
MSAPTGDDALTVSAAPARPAVRWRQVAAWACWDWGASAYNSIVVTFVFSAYLADSVARDRPPESLSGATWLAISGLFAGLAVAALAPVTGQRADAGGHRRRSL